MPRFKPFGKSDPLVVHHINGNELDNRPENLMFCTRTQRDALVGQLQALAFELVDQGRIVLENGEYRPNFVANPVTTASVPDPAPAESDGSVESPTDATWELPE